MTVRPPKSQVMRLISKNASEYLAMFKEFQTYDGGWLIWPKHLLQIKANLNIHDYVLLYGNEKHINNCLLLFMYDKEELEQLNAENLSRSEEEKIKFIGDFTEEVLNDDFEWLNKFLGDIPSTPEEEVRSKEQFDSLDDETKSYLIKKYQYLFLHFLSSIHNFFAVMVCGERMTSLVPKALNGDDEAFLKAVKIDRNLLTSHPYFIKRFEQAQASAERDFLQRLSTKQSTPNLIGKIRYPGLYIIFSMLDSLSWLNDLRHEEILKLCDAAGLDRWQNRIDDLNALTKQLQRYRRYQKTGGVSMN